MPHGLYPQPMSAESAKCLLRKCVGVHYLKQHQSFLFLCPTIVEHSMWDKQKGTRLKDFCGCGNSGTTHDRKLVHTSPHRIDDLTLLCTTVLYKIAQLKGIQISKKKKMML